MMRVLPSSAIAKRSVSRPQHPHHLASRMNEVTDTGLVEGLGKLTRTACKIDVLGPGFQQGLRGINGSDGVDFVG